MVHVKVVFMVIVFRPLTCGADCAYQGFIYAVLMLYVKTSK